MQRTYDDSLFIDTFEHDYTWLNGFMRNVRRFAGSVAVIDPEKNRRWTYRQLNEEANRLAHALAQDGVGKNDVVMVALFNSPEFCVSYIGPRKIGAILAPINCQLAAGEMALLIEHTKPAVFIYAAAVRQTVAEALRLSRWRPSRTVMADACAGEAVPDGSVGYEDYVRKQAVDEPLQTVRPHIYDEVLRLCTSGTTALPKSVPINDINEVLSAHDVIMHYPLNRMDVTLNMTPWFHRGGCHCGGPCPSFYVGCTLVVMRRFQPNTVLDWIGRYGISFVTGAPANLELLCRAQEHDARDVSPLKGLVTMGAPLSRGDCIRYRDTLCSNIFNGYGTTESFWNSFLRPYDLPEGAGTVGGSCIDDEVRVVALHDGTRAMPDDTVPHDARTEGEIIIHCAGKSSYAYCGNKELQDAKFFQGWLYTGDIGTWDENWIVTVKGRKDDMMIVSGENIYPDQIEDVLCSCSDVTDCLVTSVPDKVRGQAIVAYVVPARPDVSVADLRSFCAASPLLSRYKRPRYFAFVDSIPYTASGKKKRGQLKLQAQEDMLRGVLKRN